MSASFSIGEALREGWRLLRAHSVLIFQVVLTVFALQVVSSIVNRVLGGTLLGFCAMLVLIVLELMVGVGTLVISLKLVRGQPAHYRDILPPAELVVNYLLASILSGIVVLLPLMLFGIIALILHALGGVNGAVFTATVLLGVVAFVASMYFALRYSFVKLSVVDGAGITGSLRRSAFVTAGEKWHVLLLVIAIIGLNIVGALCLLVGLLVTLPLSLLALAAVYHKLLKR